MIRENFSVCAFCRLPSKSFQKRNCNMLRTPIIDKNPYLRSLNFTIQCHFHIVQTEQQLREDKKMQCPKCQFENRNGVKFCEECGAKFEIECPACIANSPLGRKFCGECGHNLAVPSKPFQKELSFDDKLWHYLEHQLL